MATVASLAVGLAASLWSYREAIAALHQAERQARRAQAINRFLNEDLLAASELGRSSSGRAVTLVDVLARASQAAGERFRNEPETEATMRLQLAQAHARLKNLVVAVAEFERALVLWRGLRPPADPQRLLAQFGLAGTLYTLSRTEEAAPLLAEGLRLLSPVLLAQQPALAFAAARARYDSHVAARDFKAALAAAAELQALADGAAEPDLAQRAEARLLQAEMHYQLGDLASAQPLVAALSAAPFNVAGVGPVLRARTLLHSARQDINRGDRARGEAKLIEARDSLLASVGAADFYTGMVQAELSELYAADDPKRTAQALEAALVAMKASLGPEHQSVRMIIVNKAFNELGFGDVRSALAQLDAQRPWFVQQPGRSAQVIVQAIDFRRAIALTSVGRAAEALQVLEGIDDGALAQASWGDDWPLKLKAERGRAMLASGRRAEGLALLGQAVVAMRTTCYLRSDCDGYERELQRATRTR